MQGSLKLLLAISKMSTELDSQTDDKTVRPGSFSPSVKGQGRVLWGGRPIRRAGVRGTRTTRAGASSTGSAAKMLGYTV